MYPPTEDPNDNGVTYTENLVVDQNKYKILGGPQGLKAGVSKNWLIVIVSFEDFCQ